MRTPIISVVIPVYNAEKYIIGLIESLKEQAFKEFEAVIIDDGSTDSTYKLIKDTVGNDNRFLIKRIHNSGQGVARNIGIGLVRSEFVTFADADDIVSVQWLKVLVNDLYDTGADVVNVGYANFSKNKELSLIRSDNSKKSVFLNKEQAYQQWMIDKALKGFLWNKAFKVDLIREALAPVDFNFLEDSYVVLKVLRSIKCIYMDPRVLYFYRNHNGSTVHEKFKVSDLKAIENIRLELCNNCAREFPEMSGLINARIAKIELLILAKMDYCQLGDNLKVLRDFQKRFFSSGEDKRKIFNFIEVLLFRQAKGTRKAYMCVQIRNRMIEIQKKLRDLKRLIGYHKLF